jgi:hypothetical protein
MIGCTNAEKTAGNSQTKLSKMAGVFNNIKYGVKNTF